MTGTAAWRWCLVAGVVVFACSVGFGHIPGLVACGYTGGLGPILAFELSFKPSHVAELFGAEPCRSALVAAQRTGLWLDALGFIPSYTAFLCLAGWASGRRWRRWIVVAVLIAALCDEIEGVLLFAILRALPGTPDLLATLFWPVRAKFVLLALSTGAIGSCLIASSGMRRDRLRLFALAPGLAIGIAAAFALAQLPSWAGAAKMMQAFTVAWTLLLLVAGVGVFWPRLLAAPRPAPAPPSA